MEIETHAHYLSCFSSHDLIGEFSTNLQEMAKASTQNVKWPVSMH